MYVKCSDNERRQPNRKQHEREDESLTLQFAHSSTSTQVRRSEPMWFGHSLQSQSPSLTFMITRLNMIIKCLKCISTRWASQDVRTTGVRTYSAADSRSYRFCWGRHECEVMRLVRPKRNSALSQLCQALKTA